MKLITSEEASNHYELFNVKGHNVLDLGCGRYGFTLPYEEYSPIYFGRNGANKVVGIDYVNEEIEFYKTEETDEKFTFITENVNGPDVIRKYIKDYSITAIKCDIEGGEVFFEEITKEDMNPITEMAIEYHSEELKTLMYSKLNEWGFIIKDDYNFINTLPHMGVIFANK